jgi:hypothetical protein
MATKERVQLISAQEMAKQGRRPAIIHFQPTNYRKVDTPEGLKRWEKLVLDCGGIHVTSAIGNAYYETTCGTGEYDDCAEEDPGDQPSD